MEELWKGWIENGMIQIHGKAKEKEAFKSIGKRLGQKDIWDEDIEKIIKVPVAPEIEKIPSQSKVICWFNELFYEQWLIKL